MEYSDEYSGEYSDENNDEYSDEYSNEYWDSTVTDLSLSRSRIDCPRSFSTHTEQ
jgi:hypothetical protein